MSEPGAVASRRSVHLPTALAIAVVAYAGADVVHEVAHALVCLLSGYGIVSISTVATQATGSSRPLAAAGSIANVTTGMIAWLAFRKARRFDATQYFLWLFGCVSMMNVGYLLFSAVLDSGDWARVIADLQPPVAWRVGMGLAGLALYLMIIRQASRLILTPVKEGLVSLGEVERLTVSAYLGGSSAMVAASLFNPIGPSLIVISGIGASFGLTCGLLRVAPIVSGHAGRGQSPVGQPITLHRGWIAAGVCVAILFIALLGPGIQF